MNGRNFLLVALLLLVCGVAGVFVFKPEIPQETCEYLFSYDFEKYLVGTDILLRTAMIPRGACVALDFYEP